MKATISKNLIAPCGMNCGICIGHLRKKNVCAGCNLQGNKPQYCLHCYIKNCDKLKETKSGFCYDCLSFPCNRLKKLDNRYRTRYGMSMLANLISIKENGIRKFVKNEQTRWLCPNCSKIVSVHKKTCIHCNFMRLDIKKGEV